MVAAMAPQRKPIADRFWPKVTKRSGKVCWPWKASLSPAGYGQINSGGGRGRCLLASRVSWEINCGPIPPGKHVLHRCDNPSCVNPKHLFLGTAKDNSDDKIKKGRFRCGPGMKGEAHPLCILSKKQVKEIRRLYASGGFAYADLGTRYGVGATTIGAIIRRQNWGWL